MSVPDANVDAVSLRRLFARFRWRITITWLLVVLEAILVVLFPLTVGIAVDRMLQDRYDGLSMLAALGLMAVMVGAIRRYYDTRIYARIYTAAVGQMVQRERSTNSAVSQIAARTRMASEMVEFLENSLPGIIDCVIGLSGALIMVWILQAKAFVACLAGTFVIVAIYALTRSTTFRLNRGLNDESEKEVDVLTNEQLPGVSAHYRRLMGWNIQMSDLETVTFSASWLVMIVVLLFSVAETIHSGETAQGKILAILMYVFAYIESVVAIPYFYQQFVRLQEISARLGDGASINDQG